MKVSIADHRIVRPVSCRIDNVVGPLSMVFDRIDAEPDDLHISFVELGLEACHVAKLGRADGREVFRVREQYAPAVSKPLVKLDSALGRLGSKIRGRITYSNTHRFNLQS